MKVTLNSFSPFRQKRNNYKPVAFKGFPCSEDNFEIKSIYDLPCPSCGIPMIRRKQLDQFIDSVRGKKSEALISALNKYDKYYHEKEKAIAEIIKDDAKKSPQKTMQEIINQEYSSRIQRTRKIEQEALSRLNQLIKNSKDFRKEYLLKLFKKYQEILFEADNSYFDEEELKEELASVLNEDDNLGEKVKEITKKLPNTHDDTFIFFTKNGRNRQDNSAYHLLVNSSITCEHIKPKSAGGEDNTENYLAECCECNSTRNDTPFEIYYGSKPKFAKNLRNYLTIVMQHIYKKELPDEYSDYVADVISTVATESNGKIKIDPPNVVISEPNVTETNINEKIQEAEKEIANIKSELEYYRQLKEKYENEPQFSAILTYIKLRQRKESLTLNNEKLQKALEEQKAAVDKYYLKSAEKKLKKKEFEKLDPDSKKASSLRKKISDLSNFLSNNNIQELEAEYQKLQATTEKSQKNEADIDSKIDEIKIQIVFPSDVKSQIEDLKAKIQLINESYLKIKELGEIIKGGTSVEKQIEAKEDEIARLNEENRNIQFSSNNPIAAEEYQNLLALLARITPAKELYQTINLKRRKQIDLTIFDLARKQVNEEIENLLKDNPNIRYQVNLETMGKITQEIKKLQEDISHVQKAKEDIILIKQNLMKLGTIKDIEAQIRQKEELLEEAKERFDATNAQDTIERLELKLNRKKQQVAALKRQCST